MTRILLLGAAMLFLWMHSTVSAQDNLPPCDQAHVVYEKYVPAPSEIKLTEVTNAPTPAETLEKSPQGTKWFTQTRPDFMKNGPWTTTVLIGDQNATLWKLVFPNHGSGGVQASWINDQLLFLRVWPGRIVSIDLILSVETGKFIYSQWANYGLLTQPCK